MPAERVTMRKIKDILRLKWACGLSNRQVAASCGVARSTVAGAGVDVSCTVSIGVASLRPSDTCAEDCLLRADRAMYRAKASGRNLVEIEP